MTGVWSSRVLTIAAAGALMACTPDGNAHVVQAAGAVPADAIRFSVAASGNTARYRVREQLMGRDLPNDAVGETVEVTGAITVDTTGKLIPGQARFVVRTAGLTSDSQRRDGYVRRRLLEAEQFPTVELVPTALHGLPARVSTRATSGPITFELVGNLTVRGVTRPTTWRVTARQAGDQVAGTASTKFTFADFGIAPPRVPIVLSVADTIGLEYDFTLTRDGSGAD